MKLALLFAAPILIALASSAMGQSAESAKKEVMELGSKWEAAVNNRTSADAAAKTIAAFFTDDAVLNLSTSPTVGKTEIEKLYSTLIEKNDPSEVAIKVTDVQAAGNLAWAYGTTSEKLHGKPINIFWGAVYESSDGGPYKIKMLTGGTQSLVPPQESSSK
ncbi:MAG TPA: nuclear transport factor 2 family protein [Stellaceae bacterium]|nr:nuclear transport factor 2 family protein [Stellaceae bacterium]